LVSDAMVIDGDGTIKFRCGAVLSFLFSWRILLVPCVMPQLGRHHPWYIPSDVRAPSASSTAPIFSSAVVLFFISTRFLGEQGLLGDEYKKFYMPRSSAPVVG
jgi:hypothetical protein